MTGCFFFATNVTSGDDWNAQDEARSAWRLAGSGADIASIVSKWNDLVEADFQRDLLKNSQFEAERDGIWINGIFALRGQAKIVVERLTIGYSSQAHRFVSQRFYPRLEPYIVYPYGAASIAQEFGDAWFGFRLRTSTFSQRSMEWAALEKEKIDAAQPELKNAALLEELENKTIQLHAKGSSVHAPFDVATLSVADGIKWIRKKANCQAD